MRSPTEIVGIHPFGITQPAPRLEAPGTFVRPIYTLALVWVMLLPLLFFVVRGTFSLDRPDFGGFSVSEEQALNSTNSGSAYFQAQQVLMYVIVIAVIFPSIYNLGDVVRRNAFIFTLPCFAMISVLWSQSIAKTLPYGVFIVVLTLFGVYLTYKFTPERQLELFLFVGWVSILLSLVAVVAYPSAGIALSYGTGAWRGIWVQKNHCGEIMTLLLYPAFCIKPRNASQKAALFAYGLLGTVLIVMSQSRTAWILWALSLAFILFLSLYQRFRAFDRLFLVIFIMGTAAVLTTLALTYASDIALALGKDPSLTGRTEIWRSVGDELQKRPLTGFGYRAFWLGMEGESGLLALSSGNVGLTNSENAVLEIALELGLIGVILLLVTLYRACRNAVTCLRVDAPGYIRWYILIVFFNVLSVVDGEKIMFPHTIEWLLLVVAYVGLSTEARRIRSQGTA
jgi:exopolysaccharide production protein ExoQ